LAIALAAAAQCRGAAAEPADPYEQLAALAGEWEANLPGFGKLTNSIRLVSNGTAIEETIGTPADNETSLYTHAGAGLLLTHFCALTPAGHIARLALQPRQGTQPLEFVFVGASNLPGPNAPHMRRVVISSLLRPRSFQRAVDQERERQGHGVRPALHAPLAA
jgi:hypothetical protein